MSNLKQLDPLSKSEESYIQSDRDDLKILERITALEARLGTTDQSLLPIKKDIQMLRLESEESMLHILKKLEMVVNGRNGNLSQRLSDIEAKVALLEERTERLMNIPPLRMLRGLRRRLFFRSQIRR